MAWATVITSSTILWSDDSAFQGTLLLVFLPPDLSPGSYPYIYPRYLLGARNLPIALPKRMPIPIINGVLQDNQILTQDSLDPPNVKLYPFWLDRAGALIASGVIFDITAEGDYTITPPTLTVPTAETDAPSLSDVLAGI